MLMPDKFQRCGEDKSHHNIANKRYIDENIFVGPPYRQYTVSGSYLFHLLTETVSPIEKLIKSSPIMIGPE